MFSTLFLITASTIGLGGGLAVIVGFVYASREREVADAGATLRAIAHRNHVTEPIPFAAPTARVNAPGLVEVQPRSQRPAPSPSHSPGELPRPASVEKPLPQAVATASEAVEVPLELPIEMAEVPTEDEASIVVQHWEDGKSMTKTILSVWGIRAGGGTKYKTARARYKHYLQEVAS